MALSCVSISNVIWSPFHIHLIRFDLFNLLKVSIGFLESRGRSGVDHTSNGSPPKRAREVTARTFAAVTSLTGFELKQLVNTSSEIYATYLIQATNLQDFKCLRT